MKISIIISVYKNVKALKLVLDSILNQTVQIDEIIISEDGESIEMKEFVSTLKDMKNIVHLTSSDDGWRKNRALNKAIVAATGEYLIFIDGDVVLHKRFVEGHLSMARPKRVCAGKRAELGAGYTQKLLDGTLSVDELSNSFIRKIVSLHKDKIRHYEDGIYIKPDEFLFKNFVSKKHISYLIGCNFSCFKKDILSINGFNEDYQLPSTGEDVDINWRFRADGTEVVSVRNIANVYHLYHKKSFGATEGEINGKIFHDTMGKNQFVCLNGIKKLKEGESL